MDREQYHTATRDLIIPMDMANSWSPTRPMSEYTNSSSTPPAAKKIFSIMVISAPLLYVSLLHIPPSSLLNDTKFWFLVSNAIILVLAADSRMFDTTCVDAASDGPAEAYDEYMKHSRRNKSSGGSVCPVQGPSQSQPKEEEELTVHVHLSLVPVLVGAGGEKEEASSKVIRRHPRRSTSEPGARRSRGTKSRNVVLRKSKTEKMSHVQVLEEESEYLTMSDEELNRRVEEFIRKFNMEIRRQHMGEQRDHI